ncbi:putative f-box domain protein [Phaeoacremonium minimum UCRPA7]|uniref:Putative f-box domain protein n=1 Tax=Phaeoacremonium minimum (strain UCR-PA7) TaxID=1286976 RepID=R8BKV6_PHAM7|nr:putative f-box domain protein [Phaeoacremonium minimum UCRPA7]EON99919.1 putative f-box domain protein [Phaeoacremonium minimum UCRPA7]
MVPFSADLYQHVFSFLPQRTVLDCRLLNKSVGGLATVLAFRHVRLEACRAAPVGFIKLAFNEGLRNLVREITLDTWVGPEFNYHANLNYEEPKAFLRALPHLRSFRNLMKLNVRFNEYCGNEDGDDWGGISFEETYDFRFCILDAVFRCVAGTWTESYQREWLEEHDLEDDVSDEDVQDTFLGYLDANDMFPTTPMQLTSLTISNLADYDDRRLTSSEAFMTVMALPSLRELKVLVTVELVDYAPEDAVWLPEQYDFFESLPQTWLSPSIAQDLRVLSLYSVDYWGWNPKMDFRVVNPLAGKQSGFPNLRVLALGNYIFSHEWQVDWIASLGRCNGRGGLEELYLDDCPIMWQARNYEPFDESKTILGTDVDGNTIEICNEGYPLKEIMNRDNPTPQLDEPGVKEYDLRWHHMLETWRKEMHGLKVFKMGSGDWRGEAADIDGNPDEEPLNMLSPADQERISHRMKDTVFLNYDSPSPPAPDESDSRFKSRTSGLRQDRQHILQYLQFNIGIGPSPWLERDFGSKLMRDSDSGLAEYERCRTKDEEALKTLIQGLEKRHRR